VFLWARVHRDPPDVEPHPEPAGHYLTGAANVRLHVGRLPERELPGAPARQWNRPQVVRRQIEGCSPACGAEEEAGPVRDPGEAAQPVAISDDAPGRASRGGDDEEVVLEAARPLERDQPVVRGPPGREGV